MKKILVIEKSRFLTERLTSTLEEGRYQVVTLNDDEKILAAIRREAPDLILVSLELPKVSEYMICKRVNDNKLLRRLREDKILKDIPVIMVSQEAGEKELEDQKKLKLNADDYLIGNFAAEDLITKVTTRVAGQISVEEHEELIERAKSLLKEKLELEKKFQEFQENASTSEKRLEDSRALSENLEKGRKELLTRVDGLLQEKLELERRIQELQESVSASEKGLEDSRALSENLEQELKELSAQVDILLQEKLELGGRVRGQSEKISTLEKSLEDSQKNGKTYQELSEQLTRLSQEKEDLSKRIDEQKGRVSDLEKELHDTKALDEHSQRKRKELSKQLNLLMREKLQWEGRIRKQAEKISVLEGRLKEQADKLTDAHRKYEEESLLNRKQEEDLKKISAYIDRLVHEKENLQEEIRLQSEQILSMEKEMGERPSQQEPSTQIEGLSLERMGLEEKVKEQEETIFFLEAKLKELEKLGGRAEGTAGDVWELVDTILEEKGELENKLRELTERLSSLEKKR